MDIQQTKKSTKKIDANAPSKFNLFGGGQTPEIRSIKGRPVEEGFQWMDDIQGKIKHVLLMYPQHAEPTHLIPRLYLTYITLIENMDDDVRFTIACTKDKVGELMPLKLRYPRLDILPVESGEDSNMSPWARDKIHAITNGKHSAVVQGSDVYNTLEYDRREPSLDLMDIPTERRIAKTLQEDPRFARLPWRYRTLKLGHTQEGDILSDEKTVFIGRSTISNNLKGRELRYRRIVEKIIARNNDVINQELEDRIKKYLGFDSLEDTVLEKESALVHLLELSEETPENLEGYRALQEKERRSRKEEENLLKSIQEGLENTVGASGDKTRRQDLSETLSYLARIQDARNYRRGREVDNKTAGSMRKEICKKIGNFTDKEMVFLDGIKGLMSHIDLYMSAGGEGNAAVGDVKLSGLSGKDVAKDGYLAAVGTVLDEIRDKLVSHGYNIHRMPFLHEPGKFLLTFTNVLLEDYTTKKEDGKPERIRRVYMPVNNILDDEGLNEYSRGKAEEANKTWSEMGFEVVKIPVVGLESKGGSLRCLTQVLERDYNPS